MNKRISPVRLMILLFLILFSLFSIAPFYFMVITSTYINEAIYTGIKLLPGDYFFENLKTVMASSFFKYYGNSFFVSVTATSCIVAVSSLAGFAFAKMRFRFRNTLFLIVLGTIMIPSQMSLVGLAIEMRWLGLSNSHAALILPSMANAFGVFWMKQYIGSSVPNEIIESASIDGSSILYTFLHIVLPVIKPALITLFLLFFLWTWNDYLLPLVMIGDTEKYTIPLYISMLGQMHRVDYAARILALTLATLPILVLFGAGSKYLIRGMVSGSIKG